MTGVSEKGRNYQAEIQVGECVKIYRFTALNNPFSDLDWDQAFGNEFERCHLKIAVKIMDVICDFDRGQEVHLPMDFTDECGAADHS